ncbi:MAG: hypothetical protein HYT21_02690 [Candidatus Nealsonbacteria bacterium]|nr:hypothetical protein [Candidatus Nealsonbacteria bacterium]
MYIVNSRGEKEPFSQKKLYRSAKRAGASDTAARTIAGTIAKEIYPGIKTAEIFRKIKGLLRKEAPVIALKFNIKDGMRKLGPTGFPFEKYTGEILSNLGYEVKINQFLPGRCVRSYEIDFVAKKEKEIYVGECKYRRYFGDRVHSQEALANYARFLDISNGSYFKSDRGKGFILKPMLVTNTKFSGRALDYCRCAGVELLGWNYPENNGLEHIIDEEKLYPITILPSLKPYLKDIFAKEKTMLVRDLLGINAAKFAKKHRVPVSDIQHLINQAEMLLG